MIAHGFNVTVDYKKIAIVGMACRFPGGANSPSAYWDILKNGQDVVTQVPTARWGTNFYQHNNKKSAGKSYTFAAGVLDQVDQFDAEFFGISPREAQQMDPQQRLLLELTWEALENAGQAPQALAGRNCAVYIGIASTDYVHRRVDDLCSIDAYSMTGNTASIASNRISYIFDLKGPSVSVDTACSSSLVALHQACQSIWSGDAEMAITGGVNMLLHPFGFVGFSKASMLSPQGRCQTFDADGDGYVRAEGAAIFFLKPLAQAEADGDPIQAVIVASGINCDGHTNGITVPSSEQQGQLLQTVYARAGIDANQLTYLEAHGTGTMVGDPLETHALGKVLGQTRTKPLPIGSAKTNVGHLETASGMAGLVKVVLSLQHRAIPASLHVKNLNPRIDFAGLNLQPITEFTPLAETAEPLLMGVNSFGFGGANAHVVVQSYSKPVTSSASLPTEIFPPLVLSAKTETALQAQAQQYADWLNTVSEVAYVDVAWSTFKHRALLKQGLIAKADNLSDLQAQLVSFAQQGDAKSITTGSLIAVDSPLVWVFSGNGSQWQGMGRKLYTESPLFQSAIQEVADLFAGYSDYNLLAAFSTESTVELQQTEIAQPLLFALQVATVTVLRADGVKPAAVLGHSVGEVAAAWAAGLLSLPQAVRVIYQRSLAQAETQGLGRMAAVGISLPMAEQLITELALSQHIEIAGINSENSLTLSGDLTALELLGQQPAIKGKLFKILDLDYAFHSRAMDSVQTELLAALADLKPDTQTTDIQFISTVTGQVWDKTEALDAHYWWLNIREPVRFADAVHYTIQQGSRVFLEITPHPILRGYVTEALNAADVKGLVLATARNKQESLAKLEQAAFATHLAGCPLDLSAWFKQPGQFVNLPNYPWQRERYWYPLTEEGYDLVNRHRSHPLLGYRLKEAEATWENQLDTTIVPYLADHIVGEAVVMPAAAYVEMVLAAAQQWQEQPSYSLENLEIYKPIVLEAETTKTTRLVLNPADASFKISSKDRLSTDEWTLNVVGRLTGQVFKAQPSTLAITALQAAATHIVNKPQHYQLTQQVGLTYKTAFQGVQQVWVSELAALAELQTPDCLNATLAEHVLHPALLDAGFQVLVDIFQHDLQAGKRAALIPIQVGKLQLYHNNVGVAPCFIQVTVKKQSPRSVVANFVLTDHVGTVLAELENCRFRGVEFNSQSQAPGLYHFEPILLPRVPTPSALGVASLMPLAQAALADQAQALHRVAHFNEVVPLYDVLVGRYTWDALQVLVGVEQAFSFDDLIAKGVQPAYKPLLKQLLQLLVLHELALELDTDTWQLLAEIDYPEAAAIWLSLMETPEYLPELTWLGRSGEHLLAILTGELAATEVLMPAKSSIQEHWLAASPTWQALNPTLHTLVKQLAAQWAGNQRIRVLELRANSDVLTPALLAALPSTQTDYIIAELSAEGLAQAQDTYSEYDYVQCIPLAFDLSGDAYQTLLSQGFDIIIAGNVLHQLTPLPIALRRLQALFQQGGVVLALEHLPDTLITFTEGLESQHWLAVEDNKQSHVLRRLPVATWQAVLAEAGFINSHCLLEPDAIGEQGACLLMAEAQAQAKIPSESVAASEHWLITADSQGYSYDLATVLQTQLSAAGHTVQLSTHLEQTLQAVTNTAFSQIVHLAGLATVSQLAEHSLLDLQTARCTDLINLAQTLEAVGEHRPKLWLITAGASPLSLQEQAALLPEQAPLWGFGRVLMNEHPDLNPCLIDLQTDLVVAQAAELLSKELLSPANEDELVLGADARYGLRLKPTNLHASTAAFSQAVYLDFTAPGFKHLYWKALPSRTLGAHEIEIKPYATGLNFRDVMYALGWLSDEAVENGFAGASLGMELAGEVVRVGSAVDDFKVGQAVIGFAPACFSSSVITETTAVALKPAEWSYEAAATIPATFFTVYYALQHLAQLEAGEKVLIHGAAGGIGLAAIQYARYCGAEIFATAGTEEKRDLVRLMGADHVFDSRSLKFADDILALTDGKGVDVVLNSIAGEAINRNLNVLKPFGRFLELGKRDFYENTKIGLRPFRNNITYYGIDADQLLIEKPKLAKRLFAEMMTLFQAGALRPLPHRVFSADQIQDAFRYMQQSRQIGKVIVSFTAGYPSPSLPESKNSTLDLSKGSYLITGGLAGFGLETARWLVSKGAKSLILLSRSGASTQTAQQAIAEFQAQGVQVAAYACDVTDKAALAQTLQTAEQTLPALNGIIHAATVLDDGIIRKLDAERFQTVLAPKMLGAWHLHELTQTKALQFFVLYSSVTTCLGNPGQANYVAANTYLETLAHYRRQQGLSAHYIAWGPIDDVGMLARNSTVKNSLQNHLGGKALASQQALQQLEQVLGSHVAGVAVVNWDWRNIQKFMPSARANKYTNLWQRLGNETNSDNADIRSLIEGKSFAEVKSLLIQALLSEISKILRLPLEKLATNKPITELGMDSLMGMELVSIIEDRFTVKLPVMALTDGASVEKVAEKLAQQLMNNGEVFEDESKLLVQNVALKHGANLEEQDLNNLTKELKSK